MKPTALLVVAASVLAAQQTPAARRMFGQEFPPDIVSFVLTVTGVGGKTVSLDPVALAKLPKQTIATTDHGASATFEGVLLSDVLAKVDLPVGDAFHSTAASYYLEAVGMDGYRAVFSWAELDSGIAAKPVYVALKRDGKPLAGRDGSFELVIPGEKRNARWVRQLKSLRIVQAH